MPQKVPQDSKLPVLERKESAREVDSKLAGPCEPGPFHPSAGRRERGLLSGPRIDLKTTCVCRAPLDEVTPRVRALDPKLIEYRGPQAVDTSTSPG